jgi:hypothetical protein
LSTVQVKTRDKSMKIEESNTPTTIYKSRIIGALFILAFIAYGFGQELFINGKDFEKYIGALMIITNSVFVSLIGIFLGKTLRKFNNTIANIYIISRVIEAVSLSSIVLNLLPAVSISMDHGYILGMFVLGAGSIPMCFVLFNNGVVPRWLALWGIIGYSLFTIGFLLEFFGIKWSMYLLGPGGIWEVVFAVWLIITGGKARQKTEQ